MDAFFEGTPLEKWKEIILHASPTLVGNELEEILKKVALQEMMLESLGVNTAEMTNLFYANEDKLAQLEERTANLAIESMGKILGNHE